MSSPFVTSITLVMCVHSLGDLLSGCRENGDSDSERMVVLFDRSLSESGGLAVVEANDCSPGENRVGRLATVCVVCVCVCVCVCVSE